MATVLGVFKVAQNVFLQKTLTKDTAQMALFLVFNESANTKTALCTYLRLTLNGNFVGWAQVQVLREYSIACGKPSKSVLEQ